MAGERKLVQTSFTWPQYKIFMNFSELRDYLRELTISLSELVTNVSAQINNFMTKSNGDTFTGVMQFSSSGALLLPVYTADPASPKNNQIWINSTSGTVKVRIAGVTKTFTIT